MRLSWFTSCCCCCCCCCFYLLAAASLVACDAELNQSLSRSRRYVVFPNNARMGVRLNFKHNRVLPITTILAYSDGMRLTWDLPTKVSHYTNIYNKGRRSVQRREVFETMEQILHGHGLDGRACMLRALCETAQRVTPVRGLFQKIIKLILTIPEDEVEATGNGTEYFHPSLYANACEDPSARLCPFSLLGPSSSFSPLHETQQRRAQYRPRD